MCTLIGSYTSDTGCHGSAVLDDVCPFPNGKPLLIMAATAYHVCQRPGSLRKLHHFAMMHPRGHACMYCITSAQSYLHMHLISKTCLCDIYISFVSRKSVVPSRPDHGNAGGAVHSQRTSTGNWRMQLQRLDQTFSGARAPGN